ncbi:hypothetical protein, partial [Acinetobacter baumannii]
YPMKPTKKLNEKHAKHKLSISTHTANYSVYPTTLNQLPKNIYKAEQEPIKPSQKPATATEQGEQKPDKIAGIATLDAHTASRAEKGRIH